jgi:hypothetical protein
MSHTVEYLKTDGRQHLIVGNFRSDRILSYGCELYILPTLSKGILVLFSEPFFAAFGYLFQGASTSLQDPEVPAS